MNKYFSLLIILLGNSMVAMPLEEFVRKYLEVNQLIEVHKNQEELTQKVEGYLENYYLSELNLTPSFRSSDFEFPGGTQYDIKSNDVELSWDQSFQTGTKLKLEGSWNQADRSDQVNKQENYDFAARINQSLYRNWNGKQIRAENQSQRLSSQITYLKTKRRVVQACLKASNLYISTYFDQLKTKVREEIFKESRAILSTQRREYKKQLKDELDYLLAKVSYQASEESMLRQRNLYNEGISQIKRYMNADKLIEAPIFHQSLDQTKILDQQIQEKELEFYRSKVKEIESRNRWDIQLKLWGASSQKKNDYSFSNVGDNERRDYGIGLNLEIPLSSSIAKKRIAESRANFQKTEYEQRRLSIELENQRSLFNLQLKHLDERVLLVEKQLVTLNRLVKKARKKFEIRKITLKTYIDYRERMLRKKLESVEIKEYLYKTKLAWYEKLVVDPGYCL